MTWALTSSPCWLAAWAPASTAARTLPTSPRTNVVTNAPPICTCPASVTLAALHIASVAAIVAIRPLVSIRPSASPLPFRPLPIAIGSLSSKEGFLHSGSGNARRRLLLARQGQDAAEVLVRPRDHLRADHLADSLRRRRAGVDGGLDGGHVAHHHRGHQAAADLLPAQEGDVGRLQHRVGGLDQRHQALGLDHAQGFHVIACHVLLPIGLADHLNSSHRVAPARWQALPSSVSRCTSSLMPGPILTSSPSSTVGQSPTTRRFNRSPSLTP